MKDSFDEFIAEVMKDDRHNDPHLQLLVKMGRVFKEFDEKERANTSDLKDYYKIRESVFILLRDVFDELAAKPGLMSSILGAAAIMAFNTGFEVLNKIDHRIVKLKANERFV